MADAEGAEDGVDGLAAVTDLEADKNDGISCELGIRYPTLQSILSGPRNHLSIQVSYITCNITCNIICNMMCDVSKILTLLLDRDKAQRPMLGELNLLQSIITMERKSWILIS